MIGLFGVNVDGARKRIAWGKAFPVPGTDSSQVRKDAYGWFIHWSEYGNRDSAFGWEIDHAIPTVLGGSNRASNLRALHWRNNASGGGLLSGLGR